MTDTDLKALAELKPFIIRRMMRGESFETALAHAADDAIAYARQNKQRILNTVYDRCNGSN
jgi:hypothetical protein